MAVVRDITGGIGDLTSAVGGVVAGATSVYEDVTSGAVGA